MDTFTIFIVILLILSIANNLLMYNKCYISRNLPTFDSRLKSTIGFMPINLYYAYGPGNYEFIENIKTNLYKLQNKNSYITFGEPTFDEYIKINEMVNTDTYVKPESPKTTVV